MNAFIAAFGIALLSFSGVLFFSIFRKNFEKKLKYFLAFAGGVVVTTAISLGIEGIHLSNVTTAMISITGGFVGMFIIQKILPETHHHHSQECTHQTNKKQGVKILIGDAIHNIADGIIIAVAFQHSLELGLITTLGIAAHEFPQEISEFFILRDAGFSNKKTLILNFITSLSIVIGVMIGLLTSENITLQAILLSISAGVFIQIAIQDIVPFRDFFNLKQSSSRTSTFIFACGVMVILAVGILVPHSHDHDSHSHDHSDHTHEHTLDSPYEASSIKHGAHDHTHHHHSHE